ncbi:MAG: alpha/beta fold hydrolase [Planctomycetota bacterium]
MHPTDHSIPYSQKLSRLLPAQLGLIVVLLSLTGCGPFLNRFRSMGDRIIPRTALLASLGNSPNVIIDEVKHHHGIDFLNRVVRTIPSPSERTQLLLRKYDLARVYEQDSDEVIQWLEQLVQSSTSMEEVHALAELAELHANWSAEMGDLERANHLYSISLIHAYQFLFDGEFDINRNAYDPQFRSICDIYNRSLESILRTACQKEHIRPGETFSVGSAGNGIDFQIHIEGRWSNQKFEKFELVNDFEVSGLGNHYQTFGLGVPLIAVHNSAESESKQKDFYPPNLTLAMTAFAHLDLGTQGASAAGRTSAILKLYDPLEKTVITNGGKRVPLESDITTPLAYSLRNPLVNRDILATANLLDAEFAPELLGMFMIEPYDPDKIPVIMVHGLWSSPITWLRMFNDLRANRDLRNNYQFWFYAYPTGQPFWTSARQLREDLKQIKQELDPMGESVALDQLVLVGHSMGGLVSLLQVTESNDDFWNIISQQPIEDLKGDPSAIQKLRDTFYFHPNPSIDRVITIATPFQGSEFANPATQWVSHRLFTLPSIAKQEFSEIAKSNRDIIHSDCLTTATSVDALAADNPFFKALARTSLPESVELHNIVGDIPARNLLGFENKNAKQGGDGIVSLLSSRYPNAVTQIAVSAEHQEVHQHPASIYEVSRILIQNLENRDRVRAREIPSDRPRVAPPITTDQRSYYLPPSGRSSSEKIYHR